MKLSVIVPALNEAPRIEQTLAALAPMRARGCEVIVVDGGSTDGTADAAVAGCDRVIAAPRGRASQQNAGARVASGHALFFVHADTVLPANADQLVRDAILGGASWGRFDVRFAAPADGPRLPRMLAVVAAMMNARSRWSGIATGDQCLFVTREAFQRVGGFPDQPLMEDIELSRRLKRVGAPACLRERVATSPRRWLARGVWRTILLMWWLRFAYWLGASPATIARWYR